MESKLQKCTSDPQQQTFPIFKLPVELRLKIYYDSLITNVLNHLNLDYDRSDIRMVADLASSGKSDPQAEYDYSDRLISGDWSTHRIILDEAYNVFLTCREFRREGWETFWCNFPFAFTCINLARFIKSLTLSALVQVRYLKIVVSESDSRYRSLWRFHRPVDLFLAPYISLGSIPKSRFSRSYIPHSLEDQPKSYTAQCYPEFFDKKAGELP